MKKKTLLTLFQAALFCMGCGGGTGSHEVITEQQDSLLPTLTGDSTIYGLACDGCNDTILVFLPLSDISRTPDTFYVLNANKQHRVFGHPQIGDKLAVLPNDSDSTIADAVVNMKKLTGTWCYEAHPTLRQRAGMSQPHILNRLPDSLLQLLSQTREQGMQLKADNTVRPIGAFRPQQEEKESPVEYPAMKHYRRWQLFNGRLLLTTVAPDSLGQQHISDTDTATLVLLEGDSLVLRIGDCTQGFYRKE